MSFVAFCKRVEELGGRVYMDISPRRSPEEITRHNAAAGRPTSSEIVLIIKSKGKEIRRHLVPRASSLEHESALLLDEIRHVRALR